jgi:predicted N-acetyltransferase YhbS
MLLGNVFCNLQMSVTIRSIEQNDVESCGKIGYLAHKTVSSTNGYPSEQPTEEFAIGLIKRLVDSPNSWGFVAERQDHMLGSIFIHKFSPSPVAVIGPLTVHPFEEGGGTGRLLMDTALDKASEQKLDRIRLVQSPSHIRSFVLYTKCGFSLREPLFLLHRSDMAQHMPFPIPKKSVLRQVKYQNDISECNELCKRTYGFTREMELRQAKNQGIATLIEQEGTITGYTAGIGIFGHAVAKTNEDLLALIANTPTIFGPGFFVPAINHVLIKWLLENGFRIGWPANLMTIGPYQEPLTPFLPSLAY